MRDAFTISVSLLLAANLASCGKPPSSTGASLATLPPERAPAEAIWTDDFEAAKQRAGREGKDLLLDFTGSDWCGWCIRLRGEVFDQPEFRVEAPKHFVLVEIDFPRGKRLPDRTRGQNERLASDFSVQGFPTIILADAAGRAYAETGYREGGARAYMGHLLDLKARK